MRYVRGQTYVQAIGLIALLTLGVAPTSNAATTNVIIFGVNGDDGGGNPNPVCTGSATCAYSPTPKNISVGDSILFSNDGALNHTATGPTNFGPPLNVVVQPGGGSCPGGSNGNCFTTGSKSPGQTQLIGPFPNTSSFDYYCEVHGPGLMLGTLNVAGGGGGTTTTTTTTTGATTTTTGATTTTTQGGCTAHDLVVQLPASQPPMKIGNTVSVMVVVTNAGNCKDSALVTLSGTITYSASQGTTLAPGASQTLLFPYTVPVRTSVTLTASAHLSGDATPANNSDTKTYATTVL